MGLSPVKNKALVLDGSGASFPVRVALENIGYEVSTIGANPNQFQARMSETHHLIDYSDHDQLVTFVRETGCAFAIPGCTDVSFKSYASLDHAYQCLDEQTVSALQSFLSKTELSVTLSRMDLPSLDVPLNEVLSEAVNESIIVKPADAFSGRGITVLQESQWTPEQLEAALARARSASTDQCALIQRYLEGDLFSLSLFSDGQRMLVSPVVQEFISSDRRVVSSHLAGKKISQLESVRQFIDAIHSVLGSTRWFLHVQFLLDPETQEAFIIDCAARCPGDYYGVLVEMASEFPYFGSYAQVFIGGRIPAFWLTQLDQSIVRKTFHGYDTVYPSGLDFSGYDMLAFYPDLDWSGEVRSRIGVGFYRVQKNLLATVQI